MEWHQSMRQQALRAAMEREWGDGTSPQSPARFVCLGCLADLSKKGANSRVYCGKSYSAPMHHMSEHSKYEWPMGCAADVVQERGKLLTDWYGRVPDYQRSDIPRDRDGAFLWVREHPGPGQAGRIYSSWEYLDALPEFDRGMFEASVSPDTGDHVPDSTAPASADFAGGAQVVGGRASVSPPRRQGRGSSGVSGRGVHNPEEDSDSGDNAGDGPTGEGEEVEEDDDEEDEEEDNE